LLRNSTYKKKSKKYLKSKYLFNEWTATDSTNTHILLDLFKQYGFIGEELVGFKGYLNVITILTHFDSDTNNLILDPIFKKARNEGRIWPIHSSQILDRHLGNKFTIQKYWTWPDMSKTKYPFSDVDIPKIIELRESIGIYDSKVRQEYKRGYWILRNKFNY